MASKINQEFWDKIVVPDLQSIRAKAASGQPTRMDLANKIMADWGMTNLKYDPNEKTSGIKKSSGHGPSAIRRVIDILSRGNYAMAEGVRRAGKDAKDHDASIFSQLGAFGTGAWKGVSGQEKTSFSKTIEESDLPEPLRENKVFRGGVGFALDVGLDPLTFVPGANVVGAISKARKGAGAFKVFEDLAPKTVAAGRAGKKVQQAISRGRKLELPEGASTREAAPVGLSEVAKNSPAGRAFEVSHAGETMEIARVLAETPTATPSSAVAEAAARPKPPLVDANMPPVSTADVPTEPPITHTYDVAANYPHYDRFKYTPHFEQREGGTFFTAKGKQTIKNVMATTGKTQAEAKKFIADTEFQTNAPKLHQTAIRQWRKQVKEAYPEIKTKQLEEIETRLKSNPKAKVHDLLPNKSHVPDIEGASPAVNAAVREADEVIADAGKKSPEEVSAGLQHGNPADEAAVENAMTPNTKATRRPIKAQDKPIITKLVNKWAGAVNRADRVRGKTVKLGDGNPYYNVSKQKQVINELWNETGYLAKYPARRKKRILTLLRHINAEMPNKISTVTKQPMIPTDPHGNPFDVADVIDQIDIKKYKSIGDIVDHIDNYFSEDPAIRRTVPDDIHEAVTSIHNPGIVGNAVQHGASAEKFSTPAIREIAQKEAEGGLSEPELASFSQDAANATKNAVQDETGDASTAKLASDTVYTEPKITEDIGDAYKAQGETASTVRDFEVTPQGRDSVKTDRSISATLGDWFKPSRGMEAVHSLLLQGRGFREVNARLNARFLRSMARQYSKDELRQGYDALIGKLPAGNARVEEVRTAFGVVFGNMVGKSGLKDEIMKHNTQLGRSDIVMDEINKHLIRKGSKFQFSKTVELPDGTTLDLMEANPDYGWMNSMEHFKTDDPLLHLSQMRSAVESAMTERTVLMDFAKKFGSKTSKPGHTMIQGSVHLKDVWVPNELVPQVKKMLETLNTFNDPKNELLKTFDYTMRIWKTMVTVLNPRHHVNNMIGDSYLNWIAGVSNPKYYSRAARLMMSQKGLYKDITNMDRIIGENAVGLANNAKFSKMTAATLKDGTKLTGDEVMALARRAGILPSAQMTEDINASVPGFLQGITREYNPSKMSPMAGIRGASEMRDHYPRIAHFLHELEHQKGTRAEIIHKAAERVRKYHPDGTNLTQAEQKVMRRLIPFYSWLRKALPVTVEAAVHNPARAVTMPAKALLAIQTMTGIEGTNLGDPFPEDQLFPSWLHHTGVGPIFKPGTKLPMIPESNGYMMINPKLPLFDFMDQWVKSNPIKPLIGQLTPVAKIAAEISMDKNSYTGQKISENKKQYALSNTPLLGSVAKIGGGDQGLQTNFTKWFMGNAAPVDTGAYIKSARYEQKEALRKNK